MYEKHYHYEYGFSFVLCDECFQPTPASLVDAHWRDNHITPFEMIEELRQARVEVTVYAYSDRTIHLPRGLYPDEWHEASYWVAVCVVSRGVKNYFVDDPEAMIRRIYAAWRKRQERTDEQITTKQSCWADCVFCLVCRSSS